MLRLSILIAAITATIAPPASEAPDKRHSLILVGAHWCAPCMAEYGAAAGLATAAAPDRVVLAWIDRAIAIPAGMAVSIDTMPPDQARRLAERIAGAGYGLPFSALLDASGQACALWRGPLRAGDVATMRAECRRRELAGR